MSWFLYRVGRFSFRRRWFVLITWLIILTGMGVGAATLSGPTSNTFTMPGMESTEAFELMNERTPGAAADGASARVVFQAPERERLADHRAAVDDVLAELQNEHVVATTTPFDTGAVSEDGRTGYATIAYDAQASELPESVRAGFDAVASDGSSGALIVAVGGDANEAPPHSGVAEAIGILIAAIVLAITLGTLRAAGMSLLSALIGVGIGLLGITAATGLVDLGSTTSALATMLGLAVGIDYALFIVSRYRHELKAGRAPDDAAGVAVGTAGSAVVFAGLTVIIALCGLAVAQIGFLTEMGLAAALTVAVVVLIALTLMPALLGFAGRKVLTSRVGWLRHRQERLTAAGGRTMGRAWGNLVVRRRWQLLVGGLLVAGLVAIPVRSLELALPDQGTASKGSQARIAYDLISENFGPGANGPLIVLVDTADSPDPRAAITRTTAAVLGVGDPAAVIPPVPATADAKAQEAFDARLEQTGYGLITVIPKTGPSDADTAALVSQIRDGVRDVPAETGARVMVTGQTAVGVDVSDNLGDAFPKYLAVVVGLAFLLLMVIFRSVLIPLKAVAGFLVSVMFALGGLVAVAQWGWGAGLIGIDTPGPILSFLPLLLTGILFGLAMDYEIFLVSRMHEERSHGAEHRRSIVLGFQHSARVVVAAAIIMIGVFGGFAFAQDPIVKTIGLALALGVLADAFLVRMLLVPAVMTITGDRIWWMPRWLDRILPDLDIEGHALARHLGRDVGGAAVGDPVDEHGDPDIAPDGTSERDGRGTPPAGDRSGDDAT